MNIIALIIILVLLVIAIIDKLQKKHTLRSNFPLIGWGRYFVESFGPPLRQYIVASNREELPFNRVQRRYIYASAKKQNNLQGFGTDADFSANGHFFIKHSAFPFRGKSMYSERVLPARKIVGLSHGRKNPYQLPSIVNISGMSYGALSAKATEANNKGAALAGCYHNTGEGGFTDYHTYGDTVFQLGTAYYGARNKYGEFDIDVLANLIERNSNIKMIEVKISQGSKPSKGGLLPGSKVTKEIAKFRGIGVGEDSVSPGYHSEFSNEQELVNFIELIAERTGLPVGIKSAVGDDSFWRNLAGIMSKTKKGPDFITIDGGEGGTGAAPVAFADHVSLPLDLAFSKVYNIFRVASLTERITFIASGKLGFPANVVKMMAMGADAVNLGREVLIAEGCLQTQKCHEGNCPVGIATQKKYLQSGFNVDDKARRVANYITTLRKDVLDLTHACGYEHPSEFTLDDILINLGNGQTDTLKYYYK